MGKKIGRNDPCPCGSGKKYKYCCYGKERDDFSFPEDMLTGTPLDDYMYLYQGIALFANTISQFEKDGKELSEVEAEYEKILRPGEKDGIPLSLFMSWLHFDFRFGDSRETVCERFIKSEYFPELKEPGPTLMKHLAESYCTFYEIQDINQERFIFNELGTGEKWHVFRINEPFEKEALVGDIWYLRLVGPPSGAYIYTPPFIYPPESKKYFNRAVKDQKNILLDEGLGKNLSGTDLFRESCKATVPLWSEIFLEKVKLDDTSVRDDEEEELEKVIMCNTDGELLSFSKIYFRVIDKEELKLRLSSRDGFDYDQKQKDWTWYREERKKTKAFKRTVLGRLYLKGNRLMAETNSIQRAAALVNFLSHEFRGVLSYEKMESKSLDKLPRPSEEERMKFEEQQKELYSIPEVRKKMIEFNEDYYLKEWVRTKIPALDNKTPLQAVKTEEGRQKVKKLIDHFEELEQSAPDYKPKFQFDKLRKKLGLPPIIN